MSYTAEEVRKVQEQIDKADPFLIEVICHWDEDRLMQEVVRLENEMAVIPPTNYEWRRRQESIIKAVRAVLASKEINRGDVKGGVILG